MWIKALYNKMVRLNDNMKKRNVIVTLADRKYLPQAKQLFSSVYLNGGWDGEYLLLAHEIPKKELEWFEKKGIIVRKCRRISYTTPQKGSIISMSKLYLFTPYFKRWKRVIFFDSDIMVRGSLEYLKNVAGFNAVRDISPSSFNFVESKDRKYIRQYTEIKNKYRRVPFFNSGVMVFETKIIKKGMFRLLKEKYEKNYQYIYGDQAVLNMEFSDRWQELPTVFNIFETGVTTTNVFKKNRTAILKKDILSPVVHFCGTYMPWDKRNRFYGEWMDNLKKSENIKRFDSSVHKETITNWKVRSRMIKSAYNLYRVSTAISGIKKRFYKV